MCDVRGVCADWDIYDVCNVCSVCDVCNVCNVCDHCDVCNVCDVRNVYNGRNMGRVCDVDVLMSCVLCAMHVWQMLFIVCCVRCV